MLKHTGIETHEQAKVISYLFKKSVYIQEKIPIANINFSNLDFFFMFLRLKAATLPPPNPPGPKDSLQLTI